MATRTWAAVTAGSATNASNWSLAVVPSTGDLVIFNGTSVQNCDWDVLDGMSTMTINSAYTGSINLIVAFTAGALLFETT